MDREIRHKPVNIVCIVLANAAFVAACVFNAFASTGTFGKYANITIERISSSHLLLIQLFENPHNSQLKRFVWIQKGMHAILSSIMYK